MAPETADDTSTSDDWLLLCDVRTLVAQSCAGSIRAAEKLILEFARKGHFKSYRFHDPTGPTEIERGIPPTLWGAADPKLGVSVVVDFDNSTVTWKRGEPGSYTFALLINEELEEFLSSSPYYQIQLVRLCRADVLSMLRAVGLLSAVPAEPMQMQAWFDQARRDNPRRRGERVKDHIDRLYGLMQQQHANIQNPWSRPTMSRRYYDRT